VNEPFGDTVRWDLIPSFAIQGMQLIPGSNPLFGLNTLGGAISIQTKSGRTNQGGAIEASGGSWGRKNVSAEYGGVSKDGSVDYYLGVNYFDEDGWRRYSPTTVKQTFGKVGWQNESTKIDLSYLNANNDLIGNGLVPEEMMASLGRESIYTRPDQTRNFLNQLTLNGSHWINKDTMLSVNTYYRRSNRNTLNGDVNDTDIGDGGCDSSEGNVIHCHGVNNRTRTRQNAYGMQAQLAFNQDLFSKKNQFIVGGGYDRSIVKFSQSEQLAAFFDDTRLPIDLQDIAEATNFKGKTQTWHVLATDTLSLNDYVHLTASARYNHTKVNNVDNLYAIDPTYNGTANLSGNHTFNRINPSLGLTLTPNQNISIFGSYSESSRAPSTIELGCADPANACLLPNAMASDPALEQVVAKTYEGGLRGKLTDTIQWSASAYRAVNHNDIQFIYAGGSSSLGYFNNVGRTKRQGLDLGLRGSVDKFTWNANYSFIDATYDTDLTMVSQENALANPTTGEIQVKKGNQLPGIPQHQFKLRTQYQVIPEWSVGANLIAYTGSYMFGNENNVTQKELGYGGSGRTPGYTIVNLDTQYSLGNTGWKVFAKAINIFDKDYSTVGRIAQNSFDAAGSNFGQDNASAFVSPGAPRAGWIGVRYEFGSNEKK
jgi:outer membrane receptor protein involved in Fe transport